MATIKGAWKFNDKLVCNIEDWFIENVNFTAVRVTMDDDVTEIVDVERYTYDKIDMWGDGVGEPVVDVNYGGVGGVYDRVYTDEWGDGSLFQTIDFGQEEQEVSDNFYGWLTANATKLPSNYVISRKTLQDINDTIRSYSIKNLPWDEQAKLLEYIPTSDIPSKIENIYNQFWDIVTQRGERTYYEYAFSYWDCDYIRPTYKIIPKGESRVMSMFNANPSLKIVEKEYFDLSQAKYDWTNYIGYRMFYNCPNLEVVEDINMLAGKYQNTFAYCSRLHTIEILRVEERSTFVGTFIRCDKLQNITIEGVIANDIDFSPCPLLTTKSLQGVLGALKDFSGTETTKTLTLGTTNLAKLSDSEKAIATQKGWSLA